MKNPITIRRAAEILDCSTSTVRDLVRTGRLSVHRMTPRLWLVEEVEVRAISLPGQGKGERPGSRGNKRAKKNNTSAEIVIDTSGDLE